MNEFQYLLTAEEFIQYKSISKKYNSDKINELIQQAQSIDLYDVLGDFYFDLIEYHTTEDYSNLMTGSTFEVAGEKYIHDGIKAILAEYVYARYMYVINANHTPFGYQQKFTDDSQAVDRNMIKDVVKQTQIDANIKFKMVDKYLKNNINLYQRYKKANNPTINTFSQKITIIK